MQKITGLIAVLKVVKHFKLPEMKKIKNESDLFKLFGKYARHFGSYYAIQFNGKTLSADTPRELFIKVQNEYNENILCKAN